MLLRRFGQSGHMHTSVKLVSGLVHGDMPIDSQTKNTKVDRSVGGKPSRNPVALALRARCIAFKTEVTGRVDPERLEQLLPQIRFTTGWVPGWHLAPFVDLQHP